jgi:hypothetical protein
VGYLAGIVKIFLCHLIHGQSSWSQGSTDGGLFWPISEGFQQLTEVRFASFPSSGFTTMAVINPRERKLASAAKVRGRFNQPNAKLVNST